MYREEKIIDSVLCYKNTPTGNWIQMDQKQLTRKIERLQAEVKKLTETTVIYDEV